VGKGRAGRNETLVGAAVLLALVAVGAGVFMRQSVYDRELFRAPSVEPAAVAVAPTSVPSASRTAESTSELQSYLPDGLAALTPPETFTPENLSDKIDGKAELYLSAGFVRMRCQRFALVGNSTSWLEVFVYDMGNPRNAFAVFSAQRRTDADALTLTRFAYRTANAAFFMHGSDYVEIVAAQANDDVSRLMLAYAESYVRGKPVDLDTAGERVPFPPDNLDDASITLLSADVFGFDRLNQVYVARYQTAAGPITAFLSERASAEEARELAAAYQQFLLTNGGVERPTAVHIPGGKVVQVFDSYEVIFSKGRRLAGTHDAVAEDAAQQLALQLYQGLPGSDP
jgi:hypothetical protein